MLSLWDIGLRFKNIESHFIVESVIEIFERREEHRILFVPFGIVNVIATKVPIGMIYG